MEPPYHPSQVQRPGNGMAVTGMVCGIVGLALFFLSIVGAIVALLGIIFGAVGLAKAKKIGGRGKGMAIVGVVCGALGLVAGIGYLVIVLRTFTSYMEKAQSSEAKLEIHRIESRLKLYYLEKSQLPPSSTTSLPDVDGAACANGGKMAVVAPSRWHSDPAWAALGFEIDMPNKYTYHWTKLGETSGYATAVGDLDCDGTFSTLRLDVTVTNGNLSTKQTETPD